MQRMKAFIHQQDNWHNFTWKIDEFVNSLSEARNLQGRLLGKMESLGFELRNEASLETLTLDVLKSTEIEGEILNPEQVRSSIARKLGIEIAGSVESDRSVDGIVEMKIVFNERQKILLNRVLDGFEGKLTSSKWAKIAKCSKDTAIRDINDLINKDILQKEGAGGRSTNYELK